jgi:hypothetical protein
MGEVQKHNSHCLIKKESLLSSNHQPVAAKHGVRSRTNQPIYLFTFIPIRFAKRDLVTIILIVTGFNLFTPALNAQIKIEERVEIAPESYNYVPGNPTSSHTIRVDMQWTPGNYDASGHCYTMPCENIQNGTGWETGGNLTFTLDDVKAGLYEFQFAFNPPYYLWVHAEYQAYLDEQLFRADTFSIFWTGWTGGFPYYNFGYSTPLRSDFRFSGIADENCAITFTTFNIIDTALCEDSFLWNYKTEPLNLTIISGGEYASFYNIISGQKIGESFSGLLPEIDSIMIGYDNPYLGSGETSVVFQCEWGSKIKTKTVRLLSQLAEQIVVESWSGNEVNTGEEIYVNVYPLNSSDCYGYFSSPGVTYNVEIVSGNQYGNLIDAFSFNNERVQSITGLEHLDGFTYFIYTADGVSANSLDSVKIRVSTTDPSIPPTDFTVYIKPSPIYAYTEPEVLGADEEADVIIKFRDVDGTLYDFPADQTFELAVLDGCVNGNFMVDGVIDVYFANAQQPIKFVTADSIDSEFDKVLLRVGTDLSGFNRPVGNIPGEEEKKRAEYESRKIGAAGKTIKELREGFEKMVAEAKAEAEAESDTKEGGEPMFPVVTACALDNPTYPTFYNFLASVQAGCTDAPKCNVPMEFPGIELIENSNQDVCNNRTSLKSYFTPLYNNAVRNFDIDVCFNSESGFWEFSFTNNNNLFVDCLLDICVSNINNMQEILIDDVHNFPNNWGCNRVKSDIRKHFTYGLAQPNSHTLRSILLAHENEHKKDFEVLLDRARSFQEIALLSIRKPCEEFTDETAAKAYYLNLSNKIIANAYISAFDGFVELGGTPGSQKELDYEDRTNAKIYPNIIIDIYIAEVIYCQQL